MFSKILLLILVIYCCAVQAHRDTVVDMNENGDLIGLPDKYMPANINLNTDEITIGENTKRIPIEISRLYKFENDYNIRILSSWYHDRSLLPPYLTIEIKPEGRKYAYLAMLNLDNLSVIEVQVVTYPGKGGAIFSTVVNGKALK